MTEKLGVLLVDVPGRKLWKYQYLEYIYGTFSIYNADEASRVSQFGFKCTQEEAKKYPQFRWVALEEL
jgi:hypothetical protein